ncbi:MAG: Homoaconitase large subunit [bacterium ADurb.Bin243]|nr:MAG: Homoaconitase large subunit [bacterium ADurb.Bin243]
MGLTLIEKIFKNHLLRPDDEVKPGNIVWIKLDVRSARDFGGANVVKNFNKYCKGDKVNDASKTFFTFDCQAPANTIPYANNQQTCRIFAQEQGIKVYDVNAGIGSHVLIEQGIALCGTTTVGTDSHLNIMGAVGAFGQGMGDIDIAYAMRHGATWFEIPPSIKITINGKLKYPATAKDLTLFVLKEFGSAGLLGASVEFYGEAVEALSLHERITLSSMATEMGAIIGLIPANEAVAEYFRKRTKNRTIELLKADADARYSKEYTLNIDGLRPLAAAPPSPENVVEVDKLKSVKVNSVFIGSCTNGRFEDMKAAAEVVEGKRVADNIMAKIVPATEEVYNQMIESGVLKTLFKAGFIISNQGCGGCASGQIGMTGKNEVQVSTSNRNFDGKQGDGKTYLTSPVVAAYSAINGYICCE